MATSSNLKKIEVCLEHRGIRNIVLSAYKKGWNKRGQETLGCLTYPPKAGKLCRNNRSGVCGLLLLKTRFSFVVKELRQNFADCNFNCIKLVSRLFYKCLTVFRGNKEGANHIPHLPFFIDKSFVFFVYFVVKIKD